MPPKTKPNNASKQPPTRRLTRSRTRAGAAENAPIGVPEDFTTKAKSKGQYSGVGEKRKFVDAKLDEPDERDGAQKDVFGSKQNEQRTKKREAGDRTYMNPFIPEPSISVAQHEAHSHVLAQASHTAVLSNPSADGLSLFSKLLATTSNQETLPAPFQIPNSALKSRSQTPVRPPLILAPLQPAQTKTRANQARNTPFAPRPFLIPPTTHASSPALPQSTPFSTPFSSSSTQAPLQPLTRPQSPLLTKSIVSQKTSKVIADKLSAFETRVACLEDELQDMLSSMGDIKRSQRKNNDNDNELVKLRDELGELREESQAQGKILQSIDHILEGLKANGGSLDKAVGKIEKSARDNAFNTGARKAFLHFMGIRNSQQIKNIVPLGDDDDYYLVDPETGMNLLRPQWQYNYNHNSMWHADAIDFLRKKGPGIHPALTKAILDSKTDEELSKRNESIFKNFAKAYSKSGEDPETKEALRISKCTGRRKHRKIRKAQDRADVREESTMADPVWNALFAAAYQSTDETDVAGGIDPQTDSEEVAVSVPSRAWVTRPPTYRAAIVTEAIAQLDDLVKTRRKEINRSKDTKTHVGQPHARRLGEHTEKPLPYPGKGESIHLDLIDPTWLANHPESASRRMILHWTKPEEEEGVFADAEDEGEDAREQCAEDDDDTYIDPVLRARPSSFTNEEVEYGSDDLYA